MKNVIIYLEGIRVIHLTKKQKRKCKYLGKSVLCLSGKPCKVYGFSKPYSKLK